MDDEEREQMRWKQEHIEYMREHGPCYCDSCNAARKRDSNDEEDE